MKVFIGFDPRQPLAYTVCRASVERYAKKRVQVEPLRLEWLPMARRGLTEFTYSRFLVPWLCQYKSIPALFLDADIIVRADVNELLDVYDKEAAVSVVQHPGALQFERGSVMLFHCGNFRTRTLTPEWVDNKENNPLTLEWAGERVGALPAEWNHLVGYQQYNPAAKLVHYTAGIPCWPETKNSDYADWWWEEFRHAKSTVSWHDLMGNSVHRTLVEQQRLRTV